MKRKLTILLFLALCLSQAAGCGNTTTETETTPQADDTETIATETTEDTTDQVDELPAEMDFGGATIGIASSVNVHYYGYLDVAESDENTTVLDQSIYERNRNVEERLNVKITEITDGADNVKKTFTNTVTAGDDTYSIAHLADRTVFNVGLDGYLLDIAKDMPYIDLTKAYWYADGNDVLQVGGKQLAVFGEMSLGTYDYTHLLAFNQDLVKEYGLTSPYTYYEEDNWTFDTFGELISSMYIDLDGNGTMDENDLYGYHTRQGFLFPLMYTAAGVKTVEQDGDGVPVFTAPGSQTLSDVYDWCSNVFYDQEQLVSAEKRQRLSHQVSHVPGKQGAHHRYDLLLRRRRPGNGQRLWDHCVSEIYSGAGSVLHLGRRWCQGHRHFADHGKQRGCGCTAGGHGYRILEERDPHVL